MSRQLEHGGIVFLSAPVGARVEPIRALCERHGLLLRRLDDVSFGASIRDQITSAIANSDLVIALFLDEGASSHVAYEVGIAHGLNKPTLIVADPTSKLPAELLGQQILLGSDEGLEAADFWLKQLLDAPSRDRQTWLGLPELGREPHRGGDWSNLAERARSAWRLKRSSEAEAMVAQALEQSGVKFLSQPLHATGRPDFAAWVDEVEGILGNPFIVEVKGSLRGRADQKRAFDQVRRYLVEGTSRWALVLFMDGPSEPFAKETEENRLVLFQRFDEFARSLEQSDIGTTIKRLRNKAVHRSGEKW